MRDCLIVSWKYTSYLSLHFNTGLPDSVSESFWGQTFICGTALKWETPLSCWFDFSLLCAECLQTSWWSFHGDCGPICLSGSSFPLLFPSAQEQFCCCCCPNHQLRHLSLRENTVNRDVSRKLLKMKFSCRVSPAIQVKNVQVTQLLEWMFSVPPHLCCSCSTNDLLKREEALHLLLGSLSLCFSLTACWIFRAIFFCARL